MSMRTRLKGVFTDLGCDLEIERRDGIPISTTGSVESAILIATFASGGGCVSWTNSTTRIPRPKGGDRCVAHADDGVHGGVTRPRAISGTADEHSARSGRGQRAECRVGSGGGKTGRNFGIGMRGRGGVDDGVGLGHDRVAYINWAGSGDLSKLNEWDKDERRNGDAHAGCLENEPWCSF
ncbi:hypothetical protein BOTBODRAFT_525314 [Botryobasidium botryosum FD-172 SS1]|uniref:Uncharacterized protein n=1 Tax=Botryobasidium botryosum (strain FD-172 SS1) TaxID=930990 RepID=A0A067M4B0_BOTB1|nr:hypothetical protein BOTBODRAFT_525314 [Botryobasidium botryosum FD-172 SS1]